MGCNFLLLENVDVDVPRNDSIPSKKKGEECQEELDSSEDEYLVAANVSSGEEGGLEDSVIVSYKL